MDIITMFNLDKVRNYTLLCILSEDLIFIYMMNDAPTL